MNSIMFSQPIRIVYDIYKLQRFWNRSLQYSTFLIRVAILVPKLCQSLRTIDRKENALAFL